VTAPRWVAVGGRVLAASRSGVPLWSPLARWGAGLFETVGCDRGEPLLWEEHLARLAAGLAELGWAGTDPPRLEAVERLLDREGLGGPAALRLVAPLDRERPRVVAWAGTYRSPRRLRRDGAVVVPVTLPAGPLAGLKTCSYLPFRWARQQARTAGADAALLMDADGVLRETDHANLFVRLGDRVVTPPAPRRCLPGVVRAWCIAALRGLGVEVVEGDLELGKLLSSSEAWLTSSLEGLVPVRQVGEVDLAGRGELIRNLERVGVPAPGYRSRVGGGAES
jgi:branched-subunit amino acid aminotransferase/4-amino-4-deoxychorismate lyase